MVKDLKVKEVEEWRYQDKEGFIFGYPQEIQIDFLIKNGETYLTEIKSSESSGDVTLLSRKARFYNQITGIVPRVVLVAVNITDHARKNCEKLNIQVITYDELKD